MIRLDLGFALGLLLALGCAAGDGAGDEDDDEETDGLSQSDVCADYLACAAAVEPESFSSLTATYGPEGDCWTSTEEFADTCTRACQAAVDALALAHPGDEACSAYAPDAGPLNDGDWSIRLQVDESNNECYVDDDWWWTGVAETDLAAGTFTWYLDEEFYYASAALDCTFSGVQFTCAGAEENGNYTLELEGSGSYTAAEGTFVVAMDTYVCESSGDFTAHVD